VIASYALVGAKSVALIESGPGSTLQNLLEALKAHGIQPGDVKDVLLTHIHLDHAGAAGWWARQGATIHVHPLGAPHLIDPSKLLASAQRIYGEEMDSLWGEFLSAPAEKVHAVRDGEVLTLADHQIKAIDTPGHARHHYTYQVETVAFTGDVAGVRLPGYSWIAMPTPPPEFDLESWQYSLQKLAQLRFTEIYPTHFGQVLNPTEHFIRFAPILMNAVDLIHHLLLGGLSRDKIIETYQEWYVARAAEAGAGGDVLDHYASVNSLPMCVDGMIRYWKKKDPELAG
jgi:glyoxylase-like metal-dependent hydrolase (beta-lactamase superfamily II)